MAILSEVCRFLNSELNTAAFEDSSLNGLQVEGSSEVKRIATCVDAAIGPIEKAATAGANMLLVHHGLFWGRPLAVVDSHKQLLQALFASEMSLYAAHLPLDANPKYGNNFCLARQLGLDSLESFAMYSGQHIGCKGINKQEKNLDEFVTILSELPGAGSKATCLSFGPQVPKRIGIVSGSGADALPAFKEDELDTFITGEAKQFAYHFARDNKLNVIFAGHYATETVGVRELGCALEKKFKLEHTFVDFPTGI